MALRAKKPEAVQKRLKLFLYGPAGVGKSTAAVQFPHAYILDGEKGTENYAKLIAASNSVVFQTTDVNEVIAEVKALLTEKHEYRTLVIDPITTIYNDLLDRCEAQVGAEFGRHIQAANKTMKRLVNLIMALDMNVVITAHAKKEYAPGASMQVLGETFDGWKKLDYLFDLVVELQRTKGKKARTGRVVKTRLEAFPDGETFDWSYDNFVRRMGVDTMERDAAPVTLASPAQVAELKHLVRTVNLPDGTLDKWLTKANAEAVEDLPADVIAKCIDYCKKRVGQTIIDPADAA